MDVIILALEILILLEIGGAVLWVRNYLSSYMAEKGKNLATKEDIGEITRQIEGVRADYARELEGVRTELRISAHQEEVRFSRLHDLRAEAIVGLYKRLVRTEELFQQLAGGLIVSAKFTKEELEHKASEAAVDLTEFYSERRLFFDEVFIQDFEELRRTMVGSFNTIVIASAEDLQSMSRDERQEIIERRRAARDSIRHRLPDLIRGLEERMRRMLEGERDA